MRLLSLREVCAQYDVTRRAVQGYERLGLVVPTAHSKMGYLLYDQETCLKIQRIKRYQDFGFSLKEIRGLLEMSEHELKMHLIEARKRLLQSRDELDRTIETLSEYINELN